MIPTIEQNKQRNKTIDEIDHSISELIKQFGLSEDGNRILFNRVIGLQVRKLRFIKSDKFHIVNQKKIAKLIDVSYQQVAKIEAGINYISISRLMLLAEKTDTDISWFWSPVTNANIRLNKGVKHAN